MKSFEERKAEVMLRSEKILKKRKKRNKIILTLVPLCICLCAVTAAAMPNLFSGKKSTAPESSVNETESETYAASETSPQTTKPTNGSSSRLPMLEISEDEGGYGCEAYWAYDISELVNSNPWNKEKKLSTLPVYKTAADTPVTDAEFAEMEKFLKEIANKLGLDDDKLNISKNPSELSAESEGIKLKVDRTMFLTVTLDPAVTLPQKYDFSYYAPFDSMKNAAEYLKEKYSALFDQNKYALNIHGGDYDIYLRQHHYISFYCTEGDSTQKIINYNFNKIYFSPDDNGRLDLISIHRADLSDKVGDYPIITSEKAEELLKAGKYVTSVPHTLNGEENIAKVELIYRNAPWDKYYMPYYRFYVETPYEEMGDMKEYGLKEYGAYYVPAVEERYISNMPLWDDYTEKDIAVVEDNVTVYYVTENGINSDQVFLPYTPKDVFSAWKEKNGIGDEVKLIKTEIEDNSTTEKSEENGVEVYKHTMGDYFILNITVSKSLESYYSAYGEALLKESLEKTMTEYNGIEFDEYHLYLE